jgi:hypothetical protein
MTTRQTRSQTEGLTQPREEEHLHGISGPNRTESEEERTSQGGAEAYLSPEVVMRMSRRLGVSEGDLVAAAGADQGESLVERLTMESEEAGEPVSDEEVEEEGDEEDFQEVRSSAERESEGGRLEEM